MTDTNVTLDRLLAFVASHDMVDPHIDGDAVVFGVEFTINGHLSPFCEWERVSTVREARNALGY
jgi:hypothetical protein